MAAVRRMLLGFILVLAIGGALFLMTWNEPPPIEQIEITIPDERLPR